MSDATPDRPGSSPQEEPQAADAEAMGELLDEDIGLEDDDVDSYNVTPLHIAAAEGDLDAMRVLLKDGANVNAATVGGQGDIIGETPLHEAVKARQLASVELLLEAGADPNPESQWVRIGARPRTPLDLASELGYEEIERVLLAAGGRSARREHHSLSEQWWPRDDE